MLLAVGNGQKRRQGSRVVIETVHLNRTFGRPELCPGKNRQTQIYGRCIDRIQRILEAKLVFWRQVLTASKKVIKQSSNIR